MCLCTVDAPEDPNAPKPVGPTMQPAVGVALEPRSGQEWHHNLEAAIQHYSTNTPKALAISVVDPHGKTSGTSYSKFACVTCTYM